MKRILLSMLVIGILLLSACGAPATAPPTEAPPAPLPTEKPAKSEPESPPETTATEPILSEVGKNLATEEMIKGFPEVIDAAVVQHGDQVSLALIVSTGTSKARAEELGFHFLCALIEYELEGGCLEGKRPYPNWYTKEVGAGIFDYLISIVTPDTKVVAQGAKASTSSYIIW